MSAICWLCEILNRMYCS